METILKVRNCKLIKNGEFKITNLQSLWFIRGGNNVGKTTFKDLILALYTGTIPFKEAITHGEDNMLIEAYNIIGADGKPYVARLSQERDKAPKWSITDERGITIKKLEDYRKVFNYTHFVAEDFMRLSLNAKGKEEQKKLFFSLLDEQSKIAYEIADLEEKKAYDERTSANNEKNRIAKVIESFKLSEEDEQLLSQKDEALLVYEDLQKQKLELSNKIAENKIAENNKKVLLDAIETSKSNIHQSNLRIEELEKQIDELRKSKQNHLASIKENEEKITSIKIEDIPLAGEIDARLEKGKVIIDKINALNNRITIFDEDQSRQKKAIKEWEELNATVEKHRKEKQDIIAKSKLPVKELTWDNEKGLMYDGLSFIESQISTSLAWKIGVRISMALNDCPMILIGSANDLDEKSKNEICKLAEENGYVFIADEVTTSNDILHIDPYVE